MVRLTSLLKHSTTIAIAMAGIGLIAYAGYEYFFRPRLGQSPKPFVASIPLEETPKDPFDAPAMISYGRLKLLYNTGDFDGALFYAQNELQKVDLNLEYRAWLVRQISSLLTSSAWIKIQLGQCTEALGLLYQAIDIEALPEAKKGLGVCLHAEKKWPDAVKWLEDYVTAHSHDANTAALLADALESLGRFEDAIAVLERSEKALDVSVEKKQSLQALITSMRVKAKEGMRSRTESAGHFAVTYNEDEHEPIVQKVFDALENAREEFLDIFGLAALSEAQVEVILYRQEAYHESIPGSPDWSEGIFDGRIRVPISQDRIINDPERLVTILRHELSHAMLAQISNGRRTPAWFDEGLAQYLSCRGRSCNRFKFGLTPGDFLESNKLEMSFIQLDRLEAGRAYAQSLYLVRQLVSTRTEDSLKVMVQNIQPQGPIASDGLVQKLGYTSFKDYAGKASQMWKQKVVY